MGFEFSLTGNVNNCNNGILITMNVFHVKNTNKHEILYKNGPPNLQLNKKGKNLTKYLPKTEYIFILND